MEGFSPALFAKPHKAIREAFNQMDMKPDSNCPKYQHQGFGINNWLMQQGIEDRKTQFKLKQMFLNEYNFHFPMANRAAKGRAANAFISNRFKQFCNYVSECKPHLDIL